MILSLFNKKQVHAREAFSMDDMVQITHPDVNFIHLKRKPDEDIVLFATLLIEHSFKGINEVVRKENAKSVITEHLVGTGLHLSGKDSLADDISRIAIHFMNIIDEESVRLNLKVVENDACARFHTDRYDLRLLCTYVGKGTEWIEEPFVNRRMLRHGENHQIIKDFTKVQTMEPFEIGILKGEASKKNEGKGIVHRSPPISQAVEKRLLLRLDYRK